MKGKIHSFQSLGTVDGPGVRFVVFMHGCNLNCGYCHNIDVVKGEYKEYTTLEVLEKVLKYKEYFDKDGGITVSGGEPLLQSEFVFELFRLCRENGINTVLDTSGSILNDDVLKVLDYTDLVLLDIKMSNNEDYLKYIGCSIDKPVAFLKELEKKGIDCWVRNVVIEGINDTQICVKDLVKITNEFTCVKKIELLPFKNICQVKYDMMGMEFPFKSYPPTSQDTIRRLYNMLND